MIPKILHLCWLSGEAYPEKIAKCINSWKQYLPDYEIKVWDSNAFDINATKWTTQAFNKKKYAFVADYVRFYALYNYGGIYLDSDVEILKSFDDLLEKKFFFGYEYDMVPEAAVIGAEPKLDWIKNCLLYYETHDFIDSKGNMREIVAPLIMKSGFENTYSLKLIDREKVDEIDGGIIFPFDFFSSKNIFSGIVCPSENSYSIHHFNSAWLKKGLKLKIKRNIHLIIIKIFGKRQYNKLIYFLRGKN